MRSGERCNALGSTGENERSEMQIEQLILRHIQPDAERSITWIPADGMSRQAWQEDIEAFVQIVRAIFDNQSFKLTSAEISICYHRPLTELASLTAQKLN